MLAIAIVLQTQPSFQPCRATLKCANPSEKCMDRTGSGDFVCVAKCDAIYKSNATLAEGCYCEQSRNRNGSLTGEQDVFCAAGGQCTYYRTPVDWMYAATLAESPRCFPLCRGDLLVELNDCWCKIDPGNAHHGENTYSRLVPSTSICNPMSDYTEGLGLDFCYSNCNEIDRFYIDQICGCGNYRCDIGGASICYSPYILATNKDKDGKNIYGVHNGSTCLPAVAASSADTPVHGETKFCAAGTSLQVDGLCNNNNACRGSVCYCQEGGIGPCTISTLVKCKKGQLVVRVGAALTCQDTTEQCTSAQKNKFFYGRAAETCTCGKTKNCLLFQGQACVQSAFEEPKCLVNCPAGEIQANEFCACKALDYSASLTGSGLICYSNGDISCQKNVVTGRECQCGAFYCKSGQICISGTQCVEECAANELIKSCICSPVSLIIGAALPENTQLCTRPEGFCVGLQGNKVTPQSQCLQLCENGEVRANCKCQADYESICTAGSYCVGGIVGVSATCVQEECQVNATTSVKCLCGSDYQEFHSVCHPGQTCWETDGTRSCQCGDKQCNAGQACVNINDVFTCTDTCQEDSQCGGSEFCNSTVCTSCSQLIQGCQQCDKDHCKDVVESCPQGYYFYQNHCYITCPAGTMPSLANNSCIQPNCVTDEDCSTDQSKFCYLGSCKPCSFMTTDCKKCTSQKCWTDGQEIDKDRCEKGLYWFEGQCYIQCEEGLIVVGLACYTQCDDKQDCPFGYYCQAEKCASCKSAGANCADCTQGQCTQCKTGYILVSGECLSGTCENDTYCAALGPMYCDNAQCTDCANLMPNCTKCDSRSCSEVNGGTPTNDTCIVPFVLSGNKCTMGCPDGAILFNNTCHVSGCDDDAYCEQFNGLLCIDGQCQALPVDPCSLCAYGQRCVEQSCYNVCQADRLASSCICGQNICNQYCSSNQECTQQKKNKKQYYLLIILLTIILLALAAVLSAIFIIKKRKAQSKVISDDSPKLEALNSFELKPVQAQPKPIKRSNLMNQTVSNSKLKPINVGSVSRPVKVRKILKLRTRETTKPSTQLDAATFDTLI